MQPKPTERLSALHRELPEMAAPAMAKADLRKADTDEWKPLIGGALQRAVSLCGWSLKEFAAAVGRDPRQCARWLDGSERPQLDVIFAVEKLRSSVIVALAELGGGEVVIETNIRIRRVA